MIPDSNGNVFIAPLSTTPTFTAVTCYIVNPTNKAIQTLTSLPFGYYSGLCVGQSGIVYGISSQASANTAHGFYGFNPATNTAFTTQYVLQRPTSGQRGFQDAFSLSDGRIVLIPGQNNSGRLVYYSYLQNPNNNTFPGIGVANPIMGNSKGQ
jgi:hypothetical protein